MTVWTANNCTIHHVAVLGRLFTHRCGGKAKSTFNPSWVDKCGRALAVKANAGRPINVWGRKYCNIH